MNIVIKTTPCPSNPAIQNFNFKFGEHDAFVLTQGELRDYLDGREWRKPYLDLSRVIIVEPAHIEVIKLERSYYLNGRPADVTAQAFIVMVDVRKLFRRALEVWPKVTPAKWGDVVFTFDSERFSPQAPPEPRLYVMQLVRSFTDDWQRQRFIESLLSFRSLKKEQWERLMETLSRYLANGTLFGGGKGEINFRAFGMFGGIICRGEDFSCHT